MKKNQVRRLPVVDPEGKLAGIITLNDITREAEHEREEGVTPGAPPPRARS